MIRAVFPGSFDPIHFGHINIARRAAKIFDEVVVAVYDRPLKHLIFSPEERISLVRESFQDEPKIIVMGYDVMTVDFCHQIDAQVIVRGLRVFSDFETEFRMALTNQHLAPDIEVVAFITSEDHTFLSSSTVREVASLGGNVRGMVPAHVADALYARFKDLAGAHSVVPLTTIRD